MAAKIGQQAVNADDDSSLDLAAPSLRPGERCDKYEIVQLLALGGSGEVYRAVQRSIGREVALKALQFRHLARGDLKARMEMEGQALGRINHPNVVTVFDAGCTDAGVVWIAMELLVGHTLREVLQERLRLPVEEAVACAIDVAHGVGAAHREKIIHRDIKPENVFITEHGLVKVLDLGTAKLQGWGELKTTDRRRVLGTPAYMSPEHIRGTKIDVRTDVYAVGLLLYEMLAGHPFAHLAHLDDYQELARLQLFSQPRQLSSVVPSIPEALSNVVLHAMAKSPEQRPQNMDELVRQLRLAAGMPEPVVRISARPPAMSTPGAPAVGPGIGPRGTVRIMNPDVAMQRAPLRAPAPSAPPPARTRRLESQAPSASVRARGAGPAASSSGRSSRWPAQATLVGGVAGACVAAAILWWTGRGEDNARAIPVIEQPPAASAPSSLPPRPQDEALAVAVEPSPAASLNAQPASSASPAASLALDTKRPSVPAVPRKPPPATSSAPPQPPRAKAPATTGEVKVPPPTPTSLPASGL